MSPSPIPVALVMARRGRPWSLPLKQSAVAVGLALVIIGPWWWFMIHTYGDPMAFAAIAATQPDLTRHDVTFFQLLFSGRFLLDRWVETFGEFGWRLIHIGSGLSAGLAVAATMCAIGLGAVVAGRPVAAPRPERWRMAAGLSLRRARSATWLRCSSASASFSPRPAIFFR